MKKMSILFFVEYPKKGSLGIIHNIVRDENKWVYLEQGVKATRKFDGTAVMIKDGYIYKRYDAKHGKKAPIGAIPCQENPDPISGHHPHWVFCNRNDPSNKYIFEAFESKNTWESGTYELCGPKVGTNAEKFNEHILIKHGDEILYLPSFSFDNIKKVLSELDIEGIVFHGLNNKMCKIRKTDFGLTR